MLTQVFFRKAIFSGNVGAYFFALSRWKTLYHSEGRWRTFFGKLHASSTEPFKIFHLASVFQTSFKSWKDKSARINISVTYPLVKIYMGEFLFTQTDWANGICFLRLLRSIWTKLADKNRLSFVYPLHRFVKMNMEAIIQKNSNRLQTTFTNIFWLISADPADLFHIQKIIFPKKSMIFRSKICSRGAKSGSMEIAR